MSTTGIVEPAGTRARVSFHPSSRPLGGVVDGADLLTAITVGSRSRFGRCALRLARTDTIATGQVRGCVAAAVGYLVGLSEHELASAIGTALAFSPRLAVLGSDAHDIKEGIPWAAHAGVAAADLARAGFNGPRTGFDGRTFDQAVLLGAWVSKCRSSTPYFKPYACVPLGAAAIDAAINLVSAHGIDAATVEDVRVDTFERATTLFNLREPNVLEAAQYSVPFCVATAITRGG